MFPPNWPSPSNSSAASRFPQCRSWSCVRGSWAGAFFYQHIEVLCSPDPSWCCHVWFNVQQRNHPASERERLVVGTTVAVLSTCDKEDFVSITNRDSGTASSLIRNLALAMRDDDIAVDFET